MRHPGRRCATRWPPVITYHGIGYWAFCSLPAALLLLRILPAGSGARRLLRTVLLGALAVIVAVVALSY